MKTQPSNWLQMSDALKTLAAGYEKIDAVERNGGFKLPQLGTVQALNGKTNGHSNGHAAAAKALPPPHKVKNKAALKALPAPAAEAKPVKPVKAKPAAKAEKVAKAKAKAAPANANAIAIGRRAVANGERPKLVEAIAIVMGGETMTAGGILERLTARGWAPGASNPQSYISYTLSDNDEVFKRGKRGEYAVKNPKNFVELAAQWKSGKAAAKPVAKAEAPKAAVAPKEGKKAKGKTSKKAEGVASTDTDVTEVLTAAAEPEVVQEPVVNTEASSVAGDPPTTTPDATLSGTDEALQDLGLGSTEVSENPFDALT